MINNFKKFISLLIYSKAIVMIRQLIVKKNRLYVGNQLYDINYRINLVFF